MKISYNWIKQLVNFDDHIPNPEELSNTLTSLGLEVESVNYQSEKYNGFYIAYVKDKIPHPNADKLSLCTVELGDQEQVVVCGAPNVDKGQKIVLGTEGAIVPSAGFMLSKRKIRGVESNGMICSKSELELGEDDSGIWVLEDDIESGKPLAEYLDLNDTIIEIAITPNRADCTGHIGVAREIAAYYKKEILLPDSSLPQNALSDETITDLLDIVIERSDQCPRYAAKVIKGAKIAPSPQWLQSRLESIGIRPINNIVDITNYLMMLGGQPLHAFDYDTINGHKILVGNVPDKTVFNTLDGKERTLTADMLMIKDSLGPIAVAGVMGGLDSEITSNTQNILIESAYFEPGSVRKTARALGIHSDASYRYERGVDYENAIYIADLAAKMIIELAGGVVTKDTLDVYPAPPVQNVVTLSYGTTSRQLGKDIPSEEIDDILGSLGFEIVEKAAKNIRVKVPTWRVDISLPIDLVEEVARSYGYDNLPNSLSPSVDFSATAVPDNLSQPYGQSLLLNTLVGFGFSQTVHANQSDPHQIEKYSNEYIRIANPLGVELSTMRTSLCHSMLKTINHNLRLGNDDLRLFEIGKTFHSDNSTNSFVHGFVEKRALCIAMAGSLKPAWDSKSRKYDFYDIKGVWESLIAALGITRLKLKPAGQLQYPFSPDSLSIINDKKIVGTIGRISKSAKKDYDIERDVFILDIDLSSVYPYINNSPSYKKISPYPSMTRDLAFLVSESLEAGKLISLAKQNGGKYLTDCSLFDVFQDEKLGGKKSIAISLTFSSDEGTLTDDTIKQYTDKIIDAAQKQYQAELRK